MQHHTKRLQETSPPDALHPVTHAPADPVSMWLSVSEFSELVASIYHGTLEDPPWISILGRLREVLHACPVALVLRPAAAHQRAFIVTARADGMGLAREEFTQLGLLDLDVFNSIAEDRVMTAEELVGEKGWLASDYFRTWIEPFGIRYMLGAHIRGKDGSLCRLKICRPPEGQPFTEREKAICQALVPHFKQALEIFSRMDAMGSEQNFYAEAVDRLLFGTILLDRDCRVVRMNGVAEEMLAEKDGFSFSASGLTVDDAKARHTLHVAIMHGLAAVQGNVPLVEEDFSQSIAIPRQSARKPLMVRVHPLQKSEVDIEGSRPALALLVTDPEQKSRLGKELICRRYGLTPAESALAQQLAAGLSLDDASACLGIRKNTARAQLSAIFGKTGVTRQSSLVSLLLGSSEFL